MAGPKGQLPEQGLAEGRNEVAKGTPDAIKLQIKKLGLGPYRRESTGSGGEAIFVFRNPHYYIYQGQDGDWVLVRTNKGVDESALSTPISKAMKSGGTRSLPGLPMQPRPADEGNAFSGAVVRAKADGIQPGEKIQVGGKTYPVKEANATPQYVPDPVSKPVTKPVAKASAPVYGPGDLDGATAPPAKGKDGRYPIVTSGPHKGKRWSPATPGPTNSSMKEGGVPMTPKQQKFAKLAPPVDKITFADKIVGAKKEVDEMLGDVAANAMKNAVGKMRGRNRDMEESFLDDEPTNRKSSTGGRIDTTQAGVTRHHAGKSYSGAGHDAGAEDEPSGAVGRRKVGAGMGKKIGAKINRGTSKLMTKEGDMPEDMIEPQDSGEYDQEGEMAKDDIKTVVRHAQALEKILGDNDNLPEWVQAKLAKIEGMMTAVDDYMQNQKSSDMEMDEESTNKRDNRAEKAGRKVAKDIEYDEKKKDGIHGKRRGSEDSKAERAGRKVTKDIEWDEKHKKNESSDQHFDKGYYDSMDAAKKDNPKSIVKARKQPFEEESTNTRDSRAERAGRKVAKDIEYDEKKKDGIHGKRRDSEDDKAERAGRRVTKDIEYDEKKKKKKEVDETTSSGSVATGGAAAPKSSGGVSYGKGIYDSLNRQLENMISESMNINMSMNNDEHGGPKKSLTVTATDDDAVMLAGLLKMAGMGHGDEHIHAMTGDDSDMQAIHDMDHEHGDEPCADCGQTTCECYGTMEEDRWGAEQTPKLPYDMTVVNPEKVDVSKSGDSWVYKPKEPGGRVTATIPASTANKMFPMLNVDEAYGDTDATQNEPDWPTDQEGTEDAMMYSGGLDGPKSTGQTTVPVIGGQDDRMGYEGDHELRRMMEIAGLR
jgi:hypothetical protein